MVVKIGNVLLSTLKTENIFIWREKFLGVAYCVKVPLGK
jgi:hypothetical protein